MILWYALDTVTVAASPRYAGMILSVKELREVAKASPRYAGMILWDMLKQTWIQLLPAMRG